MLLSHDVHSTGRSHGSDCKDNSSGMRRRVVRFAPTFPRIHTQSNPVITTAHATPRL